ncbi:zinc finger protein CG2199-like [Rhagoletis pomonella]|uniref:zinc finger protein CG2199-like n=1 Tax=Rhagoletis pomonella TaxID=28610 RepID=UPI0017856BE2|nr:zinc finger protein CG2199-like [Rhagoletis pomonella]
MDTCSLCKNKYSKLFNPKERVLGTQLSSIINFIIGDHVEFPPKYLICAGCSAGLIKTEIVLERLSKSLPSTRKNQKGRLNIASSHNEQEENNDEPDDQSNEKANEEVGMNDSWTFHCTHCEFTTKKAKIYKRHLINKHQVDNPRIYQCMHCQETYQRINGIQNHIACVHNNKPRPKRQRRKTIAFDAPSVLSSTTIQNQLDNEISIVNTTNEHQRCHFSPL